MKKEYKDWIKKELIQYLDEKNLTIDAGNSFKYKIGIVKRTSYFKQHWLEKIDEYIQDKINQVYNENSSYDFIKYIIQKKDENKAAVLAFLKEKSPNNATKIEKDGEIKKIDTSYDYDEYQKKIIDLLKFDEDLLFHYVGNLKFMISQQEVVFELIKNYFTKEKQESLIEMYVNSSYMKNLNFEEKLYKLVNEMGVIEKYQTFFPNLKRGKKNIDFQDFFPQEKNTFIITLENEKLIKLIENDNNLNTVHQYIGNIKNIQQIKDLGIESCIVEKNKEKNTMIFFIGKNINTKYLQIAIEEYMRNILKEEPYFFSKLSIVLSNSTTFSNRIQESLILFESKIKKIYLKENLEDKLNHQNNLMNNVMKKVKI